MRRRAFTLVEVVVALGVMGVGLLPVIDILFQSRRVLSASRHVLALESVAVQVLEEARARVARRAHLGHPGFSAGSTDTFEGERDGATWTLTITATRDPGLYDVTVRAERDGRHFEVTRCYADPWASFYRADYPVALGGEGP